MPMAAGIGAAGFQPCGKAIHRAAQRPLLDREVGDAPFAGEEPGAPLAADGEKPGLEVGVLEEGELLAAHADDLPLPLELADEGGTAALTLAAFYPNRFRYAGSLSGFLYPSNTFLNGALHAGMMQYGGVDTNLMWGPAQGGRWKWHDPYVHNQLLIDNNIRLWVFSPQTLTCSDPPAMIGYCDQAQGTNRSFFASYRANGGGNAHFDFPTGGQHDWGNWAAQLGAMSGDLAGAIA